jgi:hypothetical protein
MQWLQSAFQGDTTGLTLTAIVLGLTVALILLFWIFRKIAGPAKQSGRRTRQPRLAIADVMRIDDKRRLVLVRRDDVEHLVMIGGGSDVLLEAHISREREANMRENVALDYPRAVESEAPPVEVAAPPAATATAKRIVEPQERQREADLDVEIPADIPAEPEEHRVREAQPVEPDLRHASAQPAQSVQQPEYPAEQRIEPVQPGPVEVSEPVHEHEKVSVDSEFERQEFPANTAARKAEINRSREASRQPVKSDSDVEDEMQRLLDELSSR